MYFHLQCLSRALGEASLLHRLGHIVQRHHLFKENKENRIERNDQESGVQANSLPRERNINSCRIGYLTLGESMAHMVE